MGNCANCSAPLQGPYCAQCGQKDTGNRPSVGHLIHEASVDLSHADARIWRTLGLLLLRPGELPRRYMTGRRASYLPPLRLYLSSSLLFFMLASALGGSPSLVDADSQIQLQQDELREALSAIDSSLEAEAVNLSDNEPEGSVSEAATGPQGAGSAEAAPEAGGTESAAALPANSDGAPAIEPQSPDELKASVRQSVTESLPATERMEEAPGAASPPQQTEDEWARGMARLTGDCSVNYRGPWPEFVQPRLVNTCKSARRDNGENLLREFRGYLPTAMFLLVPFFALAMKLWYWRPKRYYIEHLVFQVYNHSAFFIAACLVQLASFFLPGLADALSFALVVYFFFYCHRSLRNYYGQGRKTTILKFLSLGIVYMQLMVVGFLMVGLATVI